MPKENLVVFLCPKQGMTYQLQSKKKITVLEVWSGKSVAAPVPGHAVNPSLYAQNNVLQGVNVPRDKFWKADNV
jgi:hypothetical protein